MESQAVAIRLYPDGRMPAKDAAVYLGLAEKTLAMMRCKGTGPKFVKRGRVFYFKADLDEWLAKGCATSIAQARQQSVTPAVIPSPVHSRQRTAGKQPRA